MLSVLVYGGHLAWVPVNESTGEEIASHCDFLCCVPPATVPLRFRFVPLFGPFCPDLHPHPTPPPWSVKTCSPVGLVIWTSVWSASGCLQSSFCCGFFYSSFACRTSLSVFQLNVQIVNNNNCSRVVLFSPCFVLKNNIHQRLLEKNLTPFPPWVLTVDVMICFFHWWLLFFSKWL